MTLNDVRRRAGLICFQAELEEADVTGLRSDTIMLMWDVLEDIKVDGRGAKAKAEEVLTAVEAMNQCFGGWVTE